MADTPLTDDYVASILQRDADRSSSARYHAASGLGSLLSGDRPRNENAPKPNTRFLRNIVRDANNHNAALKRKEEEDSRARLRTLKEDRKAEDRGSKYRRRSQERYDVRHNKAGASSRQKDLKRSRHRSSSRERRPEHRRSRSPQRRIALSRRERDEERSKKDSKSSRREREEDSRRRESVRSQRDREDISPESEHRMKSRHVDSEADDSDPLDALIGPAPPPTTLPRGRGAHKSSTINSRFNPSYNPKADVAFSASENEEDDWDMALEALRDRAKWRQTGAERLRAAGFTEDEVTKWEKGRDGRRGNDERDISDVKWAKRGEGREWDRGKVVGQDMVDITVEWGRLKAT